MAVTAPTDDAPRSPLERAASAIASARRAVVADRYATDTLAVEWRDLADLAAIAGEWRELAARALEPNVFYAPAFAGAAAPVFGRGAGAALVWSGSGPRKLLGYFPARIETRRYGVKLPVMVGWTHPYGPLGTPLVEREAAEPVIAAWLAHLARDPALPGLVLLPLLPESGPFARALGAILQRAQMPCADFGRSRRAMLAATAERSDYVERALGPRKHKELRRIGRRLSDLGAVLFTAATAPDAVAAALEDFFALEAGGWKGKAGTAAAQHDDIRGFIETAIADLAQSGQVSINRLLLDGRAIAATITLRSADAAWLWKIAYDESFARYSPGVMLTLAVTERLLDDATIAQTDSCAAANHPMIDHIWRERLVLCDRLIAVRPQAGFAHGRRLEALRRAAIGAAKALRARLRRR